MELSIYEVIKVAYKSRLLFRTEAEYRAAVGVSFETIRDRRNDEKALEVCYDILNRECRRQSGENLYAMVMAYMEASAVCASDGFDWMERRQLASRKKFCRWLFRRVAAPGRKLSVAEELKFSPRDCDEALLRKFYPDGIKAQRRYDPIFVLLITFGVIKPCASESGRGRDITDGDVAKSLAALESLIRLLRDDAPQMGVLPKPMVFDVALSQLSHSTAYITQRYSVARVWETLSRIEDACLAVSSPQMLAEKGPDPDGFSMPGIWIDDRDKGSSRFWIFPENKLMAFCYNETGNGWEMSPYEFAFYRNKNDSGFDDRCMFITSRGNEQILNDGGVMQPTEAAAADYTCSEVDENGLFDEITFNPELPDCPKWMDWRSFRCLPEDNPLHDRFMKVLGEIYNSSSPHSLLFKNRAAFLTDTMDAIVAIDNNYIYLSDAPAPDRFILHCDRNNCERFYYEPAYRTSEPKMNLRDLVIDEMHPLYILPRFQNTDRPMSERQRRFAEVCRNIGIDSHITIYHTAKYPRGVLCFNDFSVAIPITGDLAELKSYGVTVINRRDEFLR